MRRKAVISQRRARSHADVGSLSGERPLAVGSDHRLWGRPQLNPADGRSGEGIARVVQMPMPPRASRDHGSFFYTARSRRQAAKADSSLGRRRSEQVCVGGQGGGEGRGLGPASPSEHPSERLVCWATWRRQQATSPASVHLVASLHRATGAAT
eukprot:262474-Chlamydomonas_euryale.AAC.1